MGRVDRPESEPDALIDGEALRHALSSLAQSELDKTKLQRGSLALLKSALQQARAGVQQRFESGAIGGLAAARALSDVQDILVQVLYDLVTKHFYYAQNPTEGERIAIVATGGYGRRQLAPQSDIDLLFVRPYKQTPWGESVIEFILQMLWDAGLKVGHATRSLDECIRLAKQDITIATALFEARCVWGDLSLYENLRRRFRAEAVGQNALQFVAAKLAERDERHLRQGESRYLVEPNIKESKGGLRDLQTLYWIGKYLYGVDEPEDLISHQVFSHDEYKRFRQAEAFLWDVRFHLHYVAGRPEDRLSFDVQPEIVRRFNGDGSRAGVEAFMRVYFLVAKNVGDLTRIFCAALEEQNKKSKPSLSRFLPRLLRRRRVEEPFLIDNGRLNARGDAFERDPVNLLRLFQIAGERDLDVHPAAMRSVTRSLDLIDENLRADTDANACFVAILTSRQNPERLLRLLNEAGVFGRFVPEFGRVVGLMQFNMYHHYTVDEHLIRAVGNLAKIERGELSEEHPLSSDIVHRVGSRQALYVAVLLHDIAKGLPGDHSETGCAIAERLCARWGLSDSDMSAVIWLVRNHLVMSDTAQRRDITDLKTIRDFVDKVQSPELLRMLLVLTVADIRAVGPGVWNGWKGQLLRGLYHAAQSLMSGAEKAHHSDAITNAKQLLADRLRDFKPELRSAALAGHSDSYWLSFDADEHAEHTRLIARYKSCDERVALSAKSDAFRSVTEITVVTADQPGLFATLAGAITRSAGSIVDAKIFTVGGIALDVFSIQDMHGAAFGDAGQVERLRRNIVRALRGELVAKSRGMRERRSGAFRINPRVRIENTASTTATVIEVEAADRPGLLFDVTRTISECDLSISSAIVATYGERAVDVFYVHDSHGSKIVDTEHLRRIEAQITKAATALEAETA